MRKNNSQGDILKALSKWGRCSIFLGAGASVSSGIPGAASIIRDLASRIRRERGIPDADNKEALEKWLKEREQEISKEGLYGWVLDTAMPSEAKRIGYFDNLINGKIPTATHIAIAELIDLSYVSSVLTTNFDRLMEYAIFQNSRYMPCVSLSNQAPEYVDMNSPRAKIFKLHGDYLYGNIHNLDHELYRMKESMARKLALAAAEPFMIVAGYSGGDSSVMEVFQELAKNPLNFRGGIFWLHRDAQQPRKEVVRLSGSMGQRGLRLLEVESSDQFFTQLLSSLNSKSEHPLAPLPDTPHHFLFNEKSSMSRFVQSRIAPLQAAEFLNLLERRSDLAPFSESAAGLDYLLARYEELGELPLNIGELADRYIDLLAGGSMTKQSKHERRYEQLQKLGLIAECRNDRATKFPLWKQYLEAVKITELGFDLEQAGAMLSDDEAYEVLLCVVGLVSDATGIIHSATIAAVQEAGFCGRAQPWSESMYRVAKLCGAAAQVDVGLVERVADWLSLELDKEDWMPKEAMSALVKIGSAVIELMVEILSDGLNDIFSREDAAIVLGGIGTRKVIDMLVQASTEADAQTAKLLVYALGKTGNPRAIEAIRKLAQKVSSSSDTLVQRSLHCLGYAGDTIKASGPPEGKPLRPDLNREEILQRYAPTAGGRSHVQAILAMYRIYGMALAQVLQEQGWPPDMKVLIGTGQQLRDAGQLFEAEIIVSECLDRYPMVPLCYHNLALIYSRQGRLYMARRYYSVGIGFNPHYSDYYNDFAVTMRRLDNLEAARSLLVTGIGMEFDNYRLWFNLASVNIAPSQKGALEDRRRIARPGGGLIYFAGNELDLDKSWLFMEAAVCLKRVLELCPNHPSASEQLNIICDLYGVSSQIKATPQEYIDVLHMNEYKLADPPAFENLSEQSYGGGVERWRKCWANGDMQGALKGLQDAHDAAPHSVEIIHNLTILLSHMNHLVEAIQLQKEALNKAPGDIDLLVNYCGFLTKAGKHHEAVLAAQHTIRAHPDSPVAWFCLAEAYKAKGENPAAREVARHAARLSPPWAWCMFRGRALLEELQVEDVLILFDKKRASTLR